MATNVSLIGATYVNKNGITSGTVTAVASNNKLTPLQFADVVLRMVKQEFHVPESFGLNYDFRLDYKYQLGECLDPELTSSVPEERKIHVEFRSSRGGE